MRRPEGRRLGSQGHGHQRGEADRLNSVVSATKVRRFPDGCVIASPREVDISLHHLVNRWRFYTMAEDFSVSERAFYEKVMQRASLPDIFDARDLTTIVFRTMRDLMTTDTDQQTEAAFKDADIADIWRDDNPIVSFLSRFRPPLEIDSELFLRRIKQEGGVPKNVTPEAVVIAVFSTARESISPEQAKEIAKVLPDALRVMWEQI